MTLRHRMAAVAGLAVALAVLAVAVTVYVAVRSALLGEIDSSLTDRTRPVAGSAFAGRAAQQRRGGLFGDLGRRDRVERLRLPAASVPFGGASGQIQLVLPDGSVRRTSRPGSDIPIDAATRRLAALGRGRFFSDLHVRGVHIRVLTVGIGGAGALQIARPLTEIDQALARILLILTVLGAAGIALAAVLGAVVARTALAPIVRFTERTETLAAVLDLSQRLEAKGGDELARLARTFNSTLDSLERSVAAQRHLVADASHELRTPIASLRANIQILEEAERLPRAERDSLRADIIDELDELTALVSDVVELARGSRPGPGLDDVRVDEIVAAVVERTRRRADALSFDVRVVPTLVRGDGDRIQRAISNLLDNARKWSPPGATVEVALEDGVLSVRDHGPGFDERDLPYVFDRFYRADGARRLAGSGLGLAIVRQAAEAHGGFARAANADDNGGGAILQIAFGEIHAAPAAQTAVVT